jgi:hypothetical protein
MTRVNCSGGQDRNTTTSETHPQRPPPKTRNCYVTGSNGFDRDTCGSDDNACTTVSGIGYGGTTACKPDNQGGYCEYNNQYFVSEGSGYISLSPSDLLGRYKSTGDTDETSREVGRALNNQERKFTNRIRELQIMGKNPLVQRSEGSEGSEGSEVHNFVGNMLFNIGIGASVIIFLISISIILIQNKIL